MMIGIYRFATILGGPLIRLYLNRRMARGKEHATRFPERLGHATLPRPDGKLIWLHGASVGEAMSVLSVVERLQSVYPDHRILVTTGTVTSAEILKHRLPETVIHQFIVVDRPGYVKRFLNHWHPDLVLWVESEFWPNLLTGAAARNIPVILINGRVSDKSFARWQRFQPMIREILHCFAAVFGQTETDSERLRLLGADNATCLGNLKDAAQPLPVDEIRLAELENAVKGRPLWLAASTHEGEEQIVCNVHHTLSSAIPGLLTIIVPRHAEHGPGVLNLIQQAGLTASQRSKDEKITPDTDIYLADTMGELGLFYRLADVVFMGKSLIHKGGQNPLEAIKLGKAVIFGPNMDNFKDTAQRLCQAGAAQTIRDESALSEMLQNLLSSDHQRQQMMAAANRLAADENNVLENVIAGIKKVYDPRTGQADKADKGD